VSAPVRWDEIESVYPTDFTLRTVPDRLEEGGDPWAGILTSKQDLAAVLDTMNAGGSA
jgi:DNA primase